MFEDVGLKGRHVLQYWCGMAFLPAALGFATPAAVQGAALRAPLATSYCSTANRDPKDQIVVSRWLANGRFDLTQSRPSPETFTFSLVSRDGRGSLTFVGSSHITSATPSLFSYLEELFVDEKPTASFIEVSDTSYLNSLPADKDEVLRTRGEPSYLGYIARERGIPVLPLELAPGALLMGTRQKFPAFEIALAHILRDVQIARDRQHSYGEALEEVASRSIAEQQKLGQSAHSQFSISNVFQLTQTVNKLWPGLDWRQVPAEWANPLLKSSSTGSIFVNAVFAEEKKIRDRHTLDLLLSQVVAGQRVIALAGRTHAETEFQILACSIASRQI